MRSIAAAFAFAAVATIGLFSSRAEAQCTTCSPLSLPSASLVGPDLAAARQTSWAISTQANAGWVAFPRQLADNERFQARERARYDLFLTTIQATALHKSGLGADVVVPMGWLESRTGSERRREFSFGDLELHGRATTLLGRSVRLTGIGGVALPTGGYTPRSGSEALGESSRALTIGRGVVWGLAEVEARWQANAWLSIAGATQGRVPLGEASDGFRWGPELRTSAEAEVRPIAPIGIALGSELSVRGSGSIIDPFLNRRIESENVGATIVSLTPAVRATLGAGFVASVNARIPVFQDLVGLQFQQGAGVFVGLGWVIGVGSSAAPLPTTTASRYVVREYGADWCEACKRLEPLFERSKRERADVRFERVDVTEWTGEELAQRVPGAKALPIVEILGHDGMLIARLEGEKAFTYAGHLKEESR